ncbi:MAG TPA: DegT/DnrJ/EryC1/StrS family aminotransferase [Bacteroidales bacterium]
MDFFVTHISSKAKEKVFDVLTSTFLSEGKLVEEFEQELCKKMGIIQPVALNSGTSALHLALILAGVEPDDEVIIPSQTFIATGLAVLMCRAKPVFADIQLETGNMSPESFQKKITEKTKAVIPVHWGGYPCDLEEITEIAKKHNIKVIEDAAHAFGAMYKNKSIGSISDFTCFSFQAIKNLTTGDGGALCCIDQESYELAKIKRWFGIDRKNSKPSLLGEREYDVTELGYKYHLNNYAAALGLANLEDIEKILQRRREIANIYYTELKQVPGIKLLNYQSDRISSYWLFTFLVENREKFIIKLKENGIPSSVVHLRIDKNTIFKNSYCELQNQNLFNELQISIPIHQQLTENDIEIIVKTIKSGW